VLGEGALCDRGNTILPSPIMNSTYCSHSSFFLFLWELATPELSLVSTRDMVAVFGGKIEARIYSRLVFLPRGQVKLGTLASCRSGAKLKRKRVLSGDGQVTRLTTAHSLLAIPRKCQIYATRDRFWARSRRPISGPFLGKKRKSQS